MLIPEESLPYFERMIYLPMVLTVLEHDRVKFEQLDVKLPRPYLNLIDGAIKAAQNDLKETKQYMRQHNNKITRDNNDGTTTSYTFYFKGYEHHRRYLNVRLRNRTEELLTVYLAKS
ncbi:hypothetical protein [Paenisporosarcina sp. NPDC076898]|uniref:hypothetical protein n=1 Tax=unclassified Paenisporosarcina TaxID=2642018 RepID=UPI003CFC97D2